jgi:ParB family chromosome partitioning protein
MTSLLRSDVATTRLGQTANAEDEATAVSEVAVPSDLLAAPQQRADIDQPLADSRASAAALPAPLLSDAAVPAPHPGPSESQTLPAVRQGPRLDRVPTLAIRPAATIPRRHLEAADLEALAASIKHNGLAQPLLVRVNPARPGIYELFAGYRRWRAALVAEVAHVPVVVFDGLSEAVALELGLLENLHRRDLTIIEEAEAFQLLIDRYGRTHEQIGTLTGRSRSQVTNMLRLLVLPDEVKDTLHKGNISFGHGRALLGAAEPAALARRIVAERLTVRETELLAAQLHATVPTGRSMPAPTATLAAPDLPQPGGPISISVGAEISASSGLQQLEAELAEAMGMELDVRTAQDGATLLIQGQSARDTAEVITLLRDALKLLRVNRAIDVLSRNLRAV